MEDHDPLPTNWPSVWVHLNDVPLERHPNAYLKTSGLCNSNNSEMMSAADNQAAKQATVINRQS